jgi:2-keto-4-pentenoate hydratase/2-oxohepta-3-ene-1,7-dioic acid hydratase in catechol pathway
VKLCRYDGNRLGIVDGIWISDITPVLDLVPEYAWPFPLGDQVIARLDRIRHEIPGRTSSSSGKHLREAHLQSPVANPTKIIGAPANYLLHIDEAEKNLQIHANQPVLRIGDAGLFLKATSSLVGASEGITLGFPDRRTDHEIELAVVIGKTCRDLSPADALACVAGYAIGLDITVRGPEERSFRKSLDSYTILGPWLVTADEIPDPDQLLLEIRVNGHVRQSSNTSNLIYDVPKLISWASEWYTLYPGDILLTGTPEGVGPIQEGDVLQCEIEKIGAMQVRVFASNSPVVLGNGCTSPSARKEKSQ